MKKGFKLLFSLWIQILLWKCATILPTQDSFCFGLTVFGPAHYMCATFKMDFGQCLYNK